MSYSSRNGSNQNHSSRIIYKDPTIKQAYIMLQENSGLKPRDEVIIVAGPEKGSNGWYASTYDRQQHVGIVGIIMANKKERGFVVKLSENLKLHFPFWALKLFKSARTIVSEVGGHEIDYDSEGQFIEVGCVKVSVNQGEAILNELYCLSEETNDSLHTTPDSNTGSRWNTEEQEQLERALMRFYRRLGVKHCRSTNAMQIRVKETANGKQEDK